MAWNTQTNILDGVNALGTLLDSCKTNVDAILTAVNDASNGLAAINAAVAAISVAEGVDAVKITAIKDAVESTTYGLAKIKQILAG